MTAIAGKTDSHENSLLLLIFNNTTYAKIGDATGIVGSTVPGSLYVSLHTADPTEEGVQNTNECTYTSYLRVAKARSGAGWTVTGGSVVPASAITFPAGTGGAGTATFFGVGCSTIAGGAADPLLYAGAISPSIVTGNGITPQLSTATAITES
ncbi:MAG TPA: hypothetical protein VMZ53_03530 [Kofleriaceae bacterium]|nr:hypothetical protein [Kofleriaceae bacterium]